MGGSRLYREYDENGNLIKLECGICHEIKEVNCFSKSKSKKDGIETKCKQCGNERNRKWCENHNRRREFIGINPKLYREYDENWNLIKKECSKCHKIKDVSCFNKDKSKKDGVRADCKQCCNERNRQYCENHKEEKSQYDRRYHENHKIEKHEYGRQYRENHKIEKHKYNLRYNENKVQQEINKMHEKVTKQLYQHKGIQYGIIYGVHNLITNRWYIGQTEYSFNIRYHGNFFKYKPSDLSKDNPNLQLLTDDIEKYGIESFEIHEVIDVAFSEKELDEKEAYYIDQYKAYDEGYNSNRGNIFKHGKSKRRG